DTGTTGSATQFEICAPPPAHPSAAAEIDFGGEHEPKAELPAGYQDGQPERRPGHNQYASGAGHSSEVAHAGRIAQSAGDGIDEGLPGSGYVLRDCGHQPGRADEVPEGVTGEHDQSGEKERAGVGGSSPRRAWKRPGAKGVDPARTEVVPSRTYYNRVPLLDLPLT